MGDRKQPTPPPDVRFKPDPPPAPPAPRFTGSAAHPRFPAASKKRGMARAIEIAEWHLAYAQSQANASVGLVADVWRTQATAHLLIVTSLKDEAR